KITEQAAQALLRATEVQIVAKPRLELQVRRPRLIGIDFPRMKIKNTRLAVALVDPAHRPARHAVRQQAKISAAAARELAIPELYGRHRNFQQTVVAKREARRRRPAVEIMANRINARAVLVSRVAQHIERPKVRRADR